MKRIYLPGAAGFEERRRELLGVRLCGRPGSLLRSVGSEELQFRGFEDGREGRAVQALEGRGPDGVGRVDPGRAVVAVAFL